MINNTPQKELLSQLDPQIINNGPELTQDLTPADSNKENLPSNNIDVAAKNRLEQGLAAAQADKDEAEIEQVRARIAQMQQNAHLGRAHLAETTVVGIQEAAGVTFKSGRSLRDIFARSGHTTLNLYELAARKAAQQEQLQQQAAANSSGSLSEANKILRFGNSTGEDDTNQKAA